MDLQPQIDEIRKKLEPRIAEIGQSEVSRRSGVAQPNISAWLRGRQTLSIDAIGRVAEAVGMELRLSIRRRPARRG